MTKLRSPALVGNAFPGFPVRKSNNDAHFEKDEFPIDQPKSIRPTFVRRTSILQFVAMALLVILGMRRSLLEIQDPFLDGMMSAANVQYSPSAKPLTDGQELQTSNEMVPIDMDSSDSNDESTDERARLYLEHSSKGLTNPPAIALRGRPTAPEIDWSDSIYQRKGWDNDPIVIVSHKLLFFTIPNVADSEFKMLFRRMMGADDWKTVDAHHENLHSPKRNGLRYLGSYTPDRQKEFMMSPKWTRAIFVRDPRERVLAAYLDQGLKGYPEFGSVKGGYLKSFCCGLTRGSPLTKGDLQPHCLPLFPFGTDATPDTFPLDQFVAEFLPKCEDPHWKPQSTRMLPDSWMAINFVGRYENLAEDGRKLLRRIGAFEEFAKGWGPEEDGLIFETKSNIPSARDQLDHFYPSDNTEVEAMVLRFYQRDYEHRRMNLTKPERWELLMGK